jgi:hypothetical protein
MKYSRRSFIGQSLVFATALFAPKISAKTAEWNSKFEAMIALTIEQPNGGRYNRPYIAVWLENSAGKSVRTLAVWVQPGKGSRWRQMASTPCASRAKVGWRRSTIFTVGAIQARSGRS